MGKTITAVVMTLCISVFSASIFLADAQASSEEKPFVFGLLLVGPYNDHGWSQAHFEGGKYLESKIPGAEMIYIDRVNPADRQGVTVPQLADDMVEKGARLIIASSDDMKDGIREAAAMHPKVNFVHISGDDALTGKAPDNLANLMGRMEYGKMMAGFTAAMTTKTGKIAYLGPLVNDETIRLAASCFLGATYAWEKVLGKNPRELDFKVTWIGFWFNIPGVTSDPTQVSRNFINEGYDIIVSGIDTTEAVVVAAQKRREGKNVWAIPYDYQGACKGASETCLGVPYYNWGPAYLEIAKKSMSGKFRSEWIWKSPDWNNINSAETSTIGFVEGPALSKKSSEELRKFINDLGSGKLNLFRGPLYYQDGSVFLKEGEIASDKKIWYMEQLLKGMKGRSVAKN